MNALIMGLLAETPLHPGSGQNTGVVDLPVAREAATGYPVIVGSSLKGALRDQARLEWPDIEKDERRSLNPIVRQIFGDHEGAGAIGVTDARLLLLPVRSLTGHFKWVTCPYLLERLQRDGQLAGYRPDFDMPRPEKDQAIVGSGSGPLFLEELSFEAVEAKDAKGVDFSKVVAEIIKPLISGPAQHAETRDRLEKQIAILHDDDFAYFAAYGLQVNARNQLNDSKTSRSLWYEETLPPDSLFYSLLISRPGKERAHEQVKELFSVRPHLQVGGNETIGQGWCAVALFSGWGSGR